MGDQPIRGSLPRQNITRRETQRCKRPYLMIPLFKKLKQDRQSSTYEKKDLKYTPIFPCRNESNETKLGDYCWVITQVEGQSRSGWSGSSVLEFGLQLNTTAYNFGTADLTHTQFQLLQNLSCGQYSGTQQMRQLGNVRTCPNHAATANDHTKTNRFHINIFN
jgi:hypothetical protein